MNVVPAPRKNMTKNPVSNGLKRTNIPSLIIFMNGNFRNLTTTMTVTAMKTR